MASWSSLYETDAGQLRTDTTVTQIINGAAYDWDDDKLKALASRARRTVTKLGVKDWLDGFQDALDDAVLALVEYIVVNPEQAKEVETGIGGAKYEYPRAVKDFWDVFAVNDPDDENFDFLVGEFKRAI